MRLLQLVLMGSIFFFTFSLTPYIHAGYEDKDLIHITHSKNKIFAFSEARGAITFDLRLKEKVLWKASKGRLGSVLTDQRLLTITSDGSKFNEFGLNLKESESIKPHHSRTIVLLVTNVRAIAFDIRSKRFIETPFALKERFRDIKINRQLAVVISSQRAIAFSAGSDQFVEVPFGLRETYQSFELKKNIVIVNTDLRFLTYGVSQEKWKEVNRN